MSSAFDKIAGTVASLFHVGGPLGPLWKNNSGNLDARNLGDTAYINVRGLDPAGSQDFVTLNYFNANSSTNVDQLLGGDIVQNANYAIVRSGSFVTSETWTDTSSGNKIKDIVYTTTLGKITTEVRSVYASNGTTVLGQVTYTYTYTLNNMTSGTVTRNV